MPLRREVIYPIFLKCIDYTGNDTFWRETFEELSYGNCYQGSYINNGFLCSNSKGKEFIYKFIDKEPDRIHQDVIKLFKEKLNIMSRNDRKILIDEIEEVEKNLKCIKNTDWIDIKKKSLKDILLQNFLIKTKKIYELTDYQLKKIYNSINLGLMLKSIKNTDIIYDNGEIKEIKGIVFHTGKYLIDIDIYSGLDDEISKSIEKKDRKLLRYL